MTVRFEYNTELIFEYIKTFELNAATIIHPRIKITFQDLNFDLSNKKITNFNLIILQKKYDIVSFVNITDKWFYELDVTENTTLKIIINYFEESDRDKAVIHDWEEFLKQSYT